MLADLDGSWAAGTVRGRLIEAGWGAELGCPGMTLDDEGEPIHGSMLSSEQLATRWADLDQFEGPEYERVPAAVVLESGATVSAYVYVLRASQLS